MDARTIGTTSLVRQLGDWRSAGRGAGYRQLADALRLMILDGRAPLGARLPGERELAAGLGVSRTTITTAYAALRDEGYLASRQGSGSITRTPGVQSARPQGEGALGPDVIDLAVAAVPAGDSVHRAYRRALEMLPAHLGAHGYEPVGLGVLREAIAGHYARRGCPTRPEQIMVTHGAVHGFALLLKLLTGPGDRVVIDHPTYPHTIDAIQQAACRPVPVGLQEDGWDVEALEAAIRQTAPRLAFLIADFHNPTGLCMDEATRRRVAELAARTRTTIVVDETLAELWLDAPAPPSLAAYDQAGRVIALGSTGKTFWGGLRVGWIRADAEVIEALTRVRPTIDLGTPVLEQLASAVLLSDGEGDIEARRARLRDQRRTLEGLVVHRFPDWRVNRPAGGLSLWAELPEAISARLAAAADAHGVRIAAGPRFGVDGAFARFVRLPFALPEAELEKGMMRLAQAWQAARSTRSGAAGWRPASALEEVY
ncbi:PLP-dependent aminotransferase family protein [Sphingosinicella sp. LHD-64]|uniref:MocR-like transcription factor YczR n=1 Tax=Sphingosinicella sp. LHD-64 TaxID=3072139 RepID=UPI00281001CC|nr:PLP-dependent aminotransferase family protein [Sphingosinicella sp. LHD-64]MDQ8755542.1 PLP-dependent aminotransferase family protein [Sphingosinicella sp. LHD-64]